MYIFSTVVSHFQRQMKMNEYKIIKKNWDFSTMTQQKITASCFHFCLILLLILYVIYMEEGEAPQNFPTNVKFTTELIGLLLRKFPSRTTGTKTFSLIFFSLCINFPSFFWQPNFLLLLLIFYYIIILIIFH